MKYSLNCSGIAALAIACKRFDMPMWCWRSVAFSSSRFCFLTSRFAAALDARIGIRMRLSKKSERASSRILSSTPNRAPLPPVPIAPYMSVLKEPNLTWECRKSDVRCPTRELASCITATVPIEPKRPFLSALPAPMPATAGPTPARSCACRWIICSFSIDTLDMLGSPIEMCSNSPCRNGAAAPG